MNTAIRAKATAITTMAAWLANFMIGQVSPIAFKNIGMFLRSMRADGRLALLSGLYRLRLYQCPDLLPALPRGESLGE